MDRKNKTQEQLKEETTTFYKEAFAVDGEVKMITTPEIVKKLRERVNVVIELNDSKRGKFYVSAFKGDKRIRNIKFINFKELGEGSREILLDIFGYKIKDGLVCNAKGDQFIDRYGNKVTLKNVAILPNPDGKGHILIEYDILSISEYLGEVSG